MKHLTNSDEPKKLQEFRGLNYILIVEGKQIVFRKRFTAPDRVKKISRDGISSVEISTKSIMPPLVVFAILTIFALVLHGSISLITPPRAIMGWSEPLLLFVSAGASLCVLMIVLRVLYATVKIDLSEGGETIFVKLRRSKAEAITKVLSG